MLATWAFIFNRERGIFKLDSKTVGRKISKEIHWYGCIDYIYIVYGGI